MTARSTPYRVPNIEDGGDSGAMPQAARAGRATPRTPSGSGHSATIAIAGHTPGPWRVEGDDCLTTGFPFIAIEAGETGPSFRTIAEVQGVFDSEADEAPLTEESRANARLISAAPDLLEALQALTPPRPPKDAMCHVGICEQGRCAHCRRVAQAHAAIRKATAQ